VAEPTTLVDHTALSALLLRRTAEVPDPDMCVVLGRSRVMSGFQPWQTRLTEFFFEGEPECYDEERLMGSLAAYSLRNKRFGK
jgi:undecaprenyl pyrophosphate synthase